MGLRGIVRLVAAGWLLLLAHPALAEWHKAESERFVIYSDSDARDLEEFAKRLERYHAAMALLTGFNPPVPSPSNRVTVYAVGSARTLKKLYGDAGANVAGFYIPRAGSSVAFTPNVKLRGNETDFTLIVLLHEYAHHFTISSTPFALPRWITEGSAEFFASAKFAPDGGVDIGLPANHRIGDLNFADKLSIREILDYDRVARGDGLRRDGFYGQAWLLFHYVSFNDKREPQYREYALKYMQGMASLQAAEEAFGDLDQLERELKAYQRSRRIQARRYPAHLLPIGNISVTALSPGMDAMMDVVLQSRRGVNREQALALLPDARATASKFPEDPAVLTALSEAEYDAGNDNEAIAAADRAIALDASQKNAYVQKGFALFRLANDAKGESANAAYAAAMRPFEALNVIENDHPLPLIYYYRSFVQRKRVPEENARAALERASQLAPFDQDLRLNFALMMVSERKNTLARQVLAPLAADPHGTRRAGRAKQLMALLEQTPDGTLVDIRNLREPVDTPDLSDAATVPD
jgi:tetratricopeptide (TPR) repeat protein